MPLTSATSSSSALARNVGGVPTRREGGLVAAIGEKIDALGTGREQGGQDGVFDGGARGHGDVRAEAEALEDPGNAQGGVHSHVLDLLERGQAKRVKDEVARVADVHAVEGQDVRVGVEPRAGIRTLNDRQGFEVCLVGAAADPAGVSPGCGRPFWLGSCNCRSPPFLSIEDFLSRTAGRVDLSEAETLIRCVALDDPDENRPRALWRALMWAHASHKAGPLFARLVPCGPDAGLVPRVEPYDARTRAGMEVRFQYMADPVWWVNRWFALSYPGSEWTIMGGFDGDYPNPPIYGTYFPPLWLSTAATDCPLAPGECFDTRRQAIRVTYDETAYDVFDSTTGWVGEWGDYGMIVDAAEEHVDLRCTDVPASWYTGLLYQSGWE